MKKFAVIVYGPPGSGKSTQAELVADAYGLIRFDTGKYIAQEIYDEGNRKNKTVQRQRRLYEKGLLCERPWVYGLVSSRIKRIIKAGYGLVLGGSPRDVYEAFDAPGRTGVYTLLQKGYGRRGVFTFLLKVGEEHSIGRNRIRKVCGVCKKPILGNACSGDTCPFCGGGLKRRKDDKPSVIKERLREFEKLTVPIFAGLKKRGYKIHEIDGAKPPYEVFGAIKKWLP